MTIYLEKKVIEKDFAMETPSHAIAGQAPAKGWIQTVKEGITYVHMQES